MSRILILYPKLFCCYSKFSRKVERIIGQLERVELCAPEDHHGYVEQLAAANPAISGIERSISIDSESITHAIVFDDGEEFPDQVSRLRSMEIPLRVIHIAITRVINIKKHPDYEHVKSTSKYEYIGRGSYWGNPYSMFEEGDAREEVIRKFKYDFDFDKFPNKNKAEVYKLAGKRLGCFCKPAVCHGDVLADFLNAWDDEQ